MALEAASAPPSWKVRAVRTPAYLFGLCVLLTAAATALVAYSERRADGARFHESVVAARDRIDERMSSYLALLRGAAGFFSARAEPVSPAEFRTFVARLRLGEHYPGTLGVGYTARFGAATAEEASARARALGWDVHVWPEQPRDEIHAIVLLEPLDAGNRAALGYDMHTEATRREAMDRARDRGGVALSGKVTLVQEQEIEGPTQPGFMVYTPVFAGGVIPRSMEERREKLLGYAYMPLRAGDLFRGIFGDATLPIGFELHDGEEPDGDSTLLFASGDPFATDEGVAVERLEIADRVWTARFMPPAHGGFAYPLALAVALLGLLLSAIVLLVSSAHERALTRELRATMAASASEEMLRVSEMFVGILGHDLRSPLNAVSMSAQALRAQRQDDPVAERVLSRILASTRRMMRMVDEILDLTRARLGGGIAVSRRPVDLGAIAQEVVDEVRQGYPEHTVELEASGDLRGAWDSERIAQVLSNLVGNAIKHDEGAAVRVRVSGAAPDHVDVSVHNAGVIPRELLPVLFDPFRSGEARSRAGGLGLGLYIACSLVRAHDGCIGVDTAEGRGTTFTVSLPRQPRQPEPAAGARAASAEPLAPSPLHGSRA